MYKKQLDFFIRHDHSVIYIVEIKTGIINALNKFGGAEPTLPTPRYSHHLIGIHPCTLSPLAGASGRLLLCAVKHSVQNGGVVWPGLRVALFWNSAPKLFLDISDQ